MEIREKDYGKILYIILQITLVILRVARVITWEWPWVFAPTIFLLILTFVIAIIIIIKEYINFK